MYINGKRICNFIKKEVVVDPNSFEEGKKAGYEEGYSAGQAAGGGDESLPLNIAEISGGTWTQATALSANGELEIEHGLTDMPDVVIISSNIFDVKPSLYNIAAMTYQFYKVIDGVDTGSTYYDVYYNGAIQNRYTLSLANALTAQGISVVDNNKFTIKTAGNRQLGAGVTYSWLAMRWSR